MRVIFWFLIWAVTLFTIDIEVVYTDGLSIKFNGWGSRLESWLRERKAKSQ